MKIGYSPLVSHASGSAGPIVASKWKGQPYFRERVIPANPKSPAQVAQRLAMANAVAWWHVYVASLVVFVNKLASGARMSGFNVSTKQNVDGQLAKTPYFLVGPLAKRPPLASFSPVTGGSTGLITLNWTAGEADPADEVYIAYGKIIGTEAYPRALQDMSDTAATVAPLTMDINTSNPGQKYGLFIFNAKPDLTDFAQAIFATATAHA